MRTITSHRALTNLRIVSGRNTFYFSTSTPQWRTPQRSPTVRANEAARQKGLPPPPPEKWPMRYLEYEVSTSDWLSTVTLKDVVAILDDFDALGLAMAKMQAKAICSEYNIDADTLLHLGWCLLDYDDFKYRDVATTLLICTLESGNPHAASFAAKRLLTDAMLTGRNKGPGVAAARKIIRERAHKGIASAIFTEGKLLEYDGRPLEALQLYQAWSDAKTENRKAQPSRNNTLTPEHGDICKSLARLRAKLGDRSGAEEAIRDAALVYDDPAAFYHLAIEFTPPGSEDAKTYLLKAASSDQPKASHELGMLYFNQSRKGVSLDAPQSNWTGQNEDPSKDTSTPSTSPVQQYLPKDVMLEKRAEAMEWFNIGAESGITASQVYLALLLREAGRADEGLEWLQRATKSDDADDWKEAVEYFKRMWRLNAPDPMLMDIESLRKSSKTPKTTSASRLAGLDDATLLSDTFQRMKKINGMWRLDDREMKKFGQRVAASWR
ncbi:MAG: hypothetical protein Q9213_008208 [Squamulea squamosa]